LVLGERQFTFTRVDHNQPKTSAPIKGKAQDRQHPVIDLKIEEFKPEFAGKMNFYLSAVDEQLRHPDDGSSIGIILCKSRNELIVEYALRDTERLRKRSARFVMR
jgi:hypothetical protein